MTEILKGVHRVRLGYVNSYIIDGDEGVTLVDALLPKKEGKIAAALEEIGRSVTDVSAIVLTHSHADHAGSAAAIKKASGAEVYASAADAPAIAGEERPPPAPMPSYLLPLKLLTAVLPPAPATEVDHHVAEVAGTELPSDLQAVDTPGHTPGHTSFMLQRDGGVLFVGDAARAKGDRIVRGYINSSKPDIDRSLLHIAEFEFETALFGHSAPIPTGAGGAFRRFASTLA